MFDKIGNYLSNKTLIICDLFAPIFAWSFGAFLQPAKITDIHQKIQNQLIIWTQIITIMTKQEQIFTNNQQTPE